MTIQSCIEVAESYGYLISSEELQSEFTRRLDIVCLATRLTSI